MSEKILRKALEAADSRFVLIFTAGKRDFGMGYIQGCAQAASREITAALAASPAPMGPDLREAAQEAVDHFFAHYGDYEFLLSSLHERMRILRAALAGSSLPATDSAAHPGEDREGERHE